MVVVTLEDTDWATEIAGYMSSVVEQIEETERFVESLQPAMNELMAARSLTTLPVVTLADLILLKLAAGGLRDTMDAIAGASVDDILAIHGVGAAIADLLASCPGLTILATSRTPLHLHDEQLFATPALCASRVCGPVVVIRIEQRFGLAATVVIPDDYVLGTDDEQVSVTYSTSGVTPRSRSQRPRPPS